jgi:hypothetical protein
MVRASGGKTPSALTASRVADLSHVDTIASEITSQKRDQATLKAHCLARDNNRCVLSGMYDIVMTEKLSDAELQNITTSDTEAAHIIAFLLTVFTEREVFTLPSYINFLTLTNPLNSVTLKPLLGVLYLEPSLVSVAFPLTTSMILAMC